MASKMRGTVVEFDNERRFGFIRPDGHIKQVVVRKEALHAAGYKSLAVGERVEFEVGLDDRHIPVAVGIRRIPGETPNRRNKNRRCA